MKNYLALALIGLTVAGAAPLSNAAARVSVAPKECLPVLRFPPENPAVTPPGHPVLYSRASCKNASDHRSDEAI